MLKISNVLKFNIGEEIGLKQGDEILAFDGFKVYDILSLMNRFVDLFFLFNEITFSIIAIYMFCFFSILFKVLLHTHKNNLLCFPVDQYWLLLTQTH